MQSNDPFSLSQDDSSDNWISISDMMAGLMVIFLFIAIVFIKDTLRENVRMENIATAWDDVQERLYRELEREFHEDLPRWNAELDRETLSVRFLEPRVFFDMGESEVKPRFAAILSDFFPRYLRILHSGFPDDIEEVRIEGHTSSEWHVGISRDQTYFNNMELSQDRTRSVLEFCLLLPEISQRRPWAQEKLTANGLSSSRLWMRNGREDKERSRRVEFRVRTNAEQQIRRILNETV